MAQLDGVASAFSRHDGPSQEATGGADTRAFMNVRTQFENAGDALIIRELIRLVAARSHIDVYSRRAPEYFVEQLDVDGQPSVGHYRRGSTVDMVCHILRARARRERCYLFLTPGAPNGEKTVKGFVKDFARLLLVVALSWLGVRVCQVGVSAERIGPRHARLLRWRSRWLYASAPRELIAYQYAKDLGIRVTGLVPDLSFNTFAPRWTPESDSTERRSGIGFCFRVDKDRAVKKMLFDLVVDYCKRTAPSDVLIFVAQVGRDVQFMREISEAVSEVSASSVEFHDLHRNIEQVFSTYGRCRIVFSNRLHALLPSLRQGAFPVALTVPELDPKIQGVFDSAGIGALVHDLRKVDASAMSLEAATVEFNGHEMAAKLESFFDELLEVPSSARQARPAADG